MKSHFYSYAGDCAQMQYQQTNKIEDAEKAYLLFHETARTGEKVDPLHSVHSLVKAADLSKEVAASQHKNNRNWLYRSLHSLHEAVRISKSTELYERTIRKAAQRTIQAYQQTQQFWCLEQAYSLQTEYAQSFANDRQTAAKSWQKAAEIARTAYTKTKDTRWFEEFSYCQVTVVQDNPRKLNRTYRDLGKFASKEFERTGDQYWKEKTVEFYGKVINNTRQDKRQRAQLHVGTLKASLERMCA